MKLLYCYLFCLVLYLFCFVSGSTDSENVRIFGNDQERISGGENLFTTVDFPYHAQIVLFSVKFFGGAIISKNFVLTAAHVVEGVSTSAVTVKVGKTSRDRGTEVPIDDIVVHPDYDQPQNNLDIAYLHTFFPIVFSDRIQPAVLPDTDKIPDVITVTGLGATNVLLQKVTLSVISQLRCQAAYPEVVITKNMLCAENIKTENKGTCKGDGGEPATTENKHIYGISSFTHGCGNGMSPSVFTYLQAREIREFITRGTGIEYVKIDE